MAGWVDMKGAALSLWNPIFFPPNRGFRFVIVILLAISGFSCGLDGGIGVANDQVPSSATYLTGGSFTGSTDVTGTAQVYLSGGTVLLHLEGLVTPTGSTYAVFLENGSPSTPFYFAQLKAVRGNQNYFTGKIEPGSHFSRVAIRVTASVNAAEVASATLAAY